MWATNIGMNGSDWEETCYVFWWMFQGVVMLSPWKKILLNSRCTGRLAQFILAFTVEPFGGSKIIQKLIKLKQYGLLLNSPFLGLRTLPLVGKSLRANCLQKHHRILHAEICANDSMIHPFSKNRRRLIMEIVGFRKKGELQKNPWYKSPILIQFLSYVCHFGYRSGPLMLMVSTPILS